MKNEDIPSAKHHAAWPRDARQHALRIAEAVERTWSHAYASDHAHIPVSTVAVLCLLQPPEPDSLSTRELFNSVSSAEFAHTCRATWRAVITAQPDLIPNLYPMLAWLWNNPENTVVDAVKAVADTAVNTGLLTLSHGDRNHQVDLLGPLLALLRSDSARTGRGQIYTPACVAEFMAALVTPEENSSFCEPAAGTGEMLRAAAEAMRHNGKDPRTVTWVAGDIDELAVACLAVNSLLWNLGPNTIFGVGNTLTEDWVTRAVRQRNECTTIAQDIIQAQIALAALTYP
ncbi:N-6 DNA methylase [Allokutzneria sp. A3M-2-11 16]|uniref:N-6 DNA methylase n=1 Tax=Allokutzneria sp. A3M-2-11 16 TaxID=2962043 RepID=UPI0020B797A9|nr:N-6 DNA methylase [Allokutzneria sp. A3M-2-11 16]